MTRETSESVVTDAGRLESGLGRIYKFSSHCFYVSMK